MKNLFNLRHLHWGRPCSLPLLLAALLVAPLQSLYALNPERQIGQYGHDSWTSQRGLPGEAVYQILQTKDGYLWLRTSAGLSRFDGVRFVSMDSEFASDSVKAICMSADGDLLVRTLARTVIYRDRQFSNYLPPALLPSGGIREIFESREHVVFIGSDDYIYRLGKDGQPHELRNHTALINSFLEDRTGKIWVGASSATFIYDHGEVSEPFNMTAYGFGPWSMMEDHLHRVWAATGAGLFMLKDSGITSRQIEQDGIPGPVKAVIEDRSGNIWAATGTQGIFRYSGGRVSSINTASGLTDDNVLSILEDREGSLWIGTASGLDRFRDTSLTTFTTREGLLSNDVHTALETREGDLYLFCSGRAKGGSVVRIRNNKVTPFEHNAALPSPYGDALYQTRDGSLWLGTIGGLSRSKNGKLTVFLGDGHFKNGFISAISEDRESLIVANTESRAMRFIDGKVLPFTLRGQQTPFTSPGGLYTFTIYPDPEGALWFGTSDGLYKLVPGQSMAHTRIPGINFTVTSIFDDRKGSLWLMGRTPGLVQLRLRDLRITQYTRRDGLFDGFGSHLLPDDDGNFWISTEDGIYKTARKDLQDFADGLLDFVPSQQFGIADGMKTSSASSTTSQPGGARTHDGRLWFATIKGIVAIDPNHLLHNDLIPPVIIESVVADGYTQASGSSIPIKAGTRAIEFHYTALSFLVPERVRFKYRLEGYDQDWVDAGPRRVAYYTNLSPGTYHFRVIASNNDGLWNTAGATVDLVLEPQFYQTAWFDTLCILLAGVLLIVSYQRKTKLIRARAEHLSKVVAERTAELENSRRELEQIAHFDALTTLPNRRMFTDTFEPMRNRTEQQGDGFSMLLIDFDRFKQINDNFGHDAGDAFLIEAAMRLRASVRSTDCVARLGGDEFAVLLAGDQVNLQNVCDRIVFSFAAAIPFKSFHINTSASVGAAIYPDHGRTQEELYKSADLALYEVKRRGRNAWLRFSPEIAQAEETRDQVAT